MSLRTPLGKVLGLGSAKDGTSHFWGQRVSALALLLLGSWFVVALLLMPDFSHAASLNFIAAPMNALLLILLIVTLSYHSNLGLQVVIEDYVHAHGLKLASLIASKFIHVLLATAAIYAILKIGFSA